MNITINLIEVASELAEMELVKDNPNLEIYEDDEEGGSRYTEQAQDIFNDLYDKYTNFLENLQVD
jgi:hypothetical protein